ncbi:hypothetical protein IPdc08_01348 [archaeon]|nr:hypothetical protein IPdc08_01348 [archaeon]
MRVGNIRIVFSLDRKDRVVRVYQADFREKVY